MSLAEAHNLPAGLDFDSIPMMDETTTIEEHLEQSASDPAPEPDDDISF